jgi:hypothetical protein
MGRKKDNELARAQQALGELFLKIDSCYFLSAEGIVAIFVNQLSATPKLTPKHLTDAFTPLYHDGRLLARRHGKENVLFYPPVTTPDSRVLYPERTPGEKWPNA